MKSKAIKWTGHQITRPGLYSGIPLDCYHAWNICDGPSISSSGLRAIYGESKASPRHFYANWNGNPNRIPPKREPRHFIVGRALHHLVLGEPYFAKVFCVHHDEWPDENGVLRPWNANRKTCQKWTAEREKEGRTVLTPQDVEQIRQMAISLGQHPLVQQGALKGAIERSLFWKDKETGIWLKSRPDNIPTDSADFVDIKTTQSVAWPSLQQTLDQFGYYRQISLLREGIRKLLDADMESFTFLFVEKNSPWATRDVRCDDDDINTGARENRAAVRLFRKCLKEKHWPGPGEGNEGNETLRLSPAARERKIERLRLEGLADGQD